MIQKFKYKRATMEDIDELVRTRIIVLRAANKLSDDEDMSVVEEKSYAYYRRALETGEHIAYLVYDNGAFVGAGGVSFYQVMPTYHNPTGKKAYIMNMYTAPEYRSIWHFAIPWTQQMVKHWITSADWIRSMHLQPRHSQPWISI